MKEVVRLDRWADRVNALRCAAREADELGQRKVPPLLLSSVTDGGDEIVSVELTAREWQAVRRYLRRNRLRILRDAGVE